MSQALKIGKPLPDTIILCFNIEIFTATVKNLPVLIFNPNQVDIHVIVLSRQILKVFFSSFLQSPVSAMGY